MAGPNIEPRPSNLAKQISMTITLLNVLQEDEYRDSVSIAQDMEENYGHYFDSVIPFDDVDYVFQQLMYEINLLEREPQWVPARWVRQPST